MLYLPFSYLCFESSSSRSGSSKKNKVIKLLDITDIQKVTQDIRIFVTQFRYEAVYMRLTLFFPHWFSVV